ncbi:MAG TPA: group III truncated hemoglobin, partial [Dongiaceae bacterium]|nr:group III truncated hemoglobin [Dongiaceae bacterium]
SADFMVAPVGVPVPGLLYPPCPPRLNADIAGPAAGRRLAAGSGSNYLGTMLKPPLPQYATDDQIETLVAAFYARIRTDPELGPIFLRAIGEDWTAHLKTMCDFWSSVMNTTGRYKGKPIPAHLKLPDIEPRHFERWLRLFSETAQGLFDADLASLFVQRAERIAESLKLAFAFHAEKPEIWGGLPEIR